MARFPCELSVHQSSNGQPAFNAAWPCHIKARPTRFKVANPKIEGDTDINVDRQQKNLYCSTPGQSIAPIVPETFTADGSRTALPPLSRFFTHFSQLPPFIFFTRHSQHAGGIVEQRYHACNSQKLICAL